MMVAAEEPASGWRNSSLDLFDDHNGIVDDQTDSCRHPAQRHDVEAHAEHGKKKHGRGQNRGHHDQRNDRDLEIAQEREQHDRGKRNSDQHRFEHARGRAEDELALIVPIADVEIGRQLRGIGGERGFDVSDDLNRVSVLLLLDLKDDRGLPVRGHDRPARRRRFEDPGNVRQIDRAGRSTAHDRLANFIGRFELIVGKREKQLVPVLDAAHGRQNVRGRQCLGDVVHREAVTCQPCGIGVDADFPRRSAKDLNALYALDRGQQRQELELRDFPDLHQVEFVGGQTVGGDGKDVGVHAPDVERRAGRQ